MSNREAFSDYMHEASPQGSNCPSSYVRAIELLDEILPRKAPDRLPESSVWLIYSKDVVQNLYEYILEQQRLQETGIFNNEVPVGYWKRRFYSAALRSYKHFLEAKDTVEGDFTQMEITDPSVLLDVKKGMIASFHQDISSEMSVVGSLSLCAVLGCLSKSFLLFTGLSGSGKTKLAQAFSMWICESKQQRNLVAVGADWTSNENLLGYPDALNPGRYRKPDNGVLDLILNAQRDEEHPYFLILDEMNLSHVERYFADFLSAMESGEPIHLHEESKEDWDGVPARLKIPKNLFVIGTVNIDETTYMFSPKVLDRANVIEFRVRDDEMSAFLTHPVKPDLDAIAGQGAVYAKAFVAAAKSDAVLEEGLRAQVSEVLMGFFGPLQEAGAEFGYRTAHEICRFVFFHQELSEGDWSLDQAMDAAVMQKLLPKLHGSKKKLGEVLDLLERRCLRVLPEKEEDPLTEEHLVVENVRYPVSLEKIQRMRKRLQQHGFTSFAEA